MSSIGQWAGQWIGNWFGSIEVDPNKMYGSATIRFTTSGDLTGASSKVAGAVGSSRRRVGVAVVELAGKEYRVPIDALEAFLASVREEPKIKKKLRTKLRKTKRAGVIPEVKLVSAPEEEVEHIQAAIDRSNEKLQYIWKKILNQLIMARDEEEALFLILSVI
jgi:hypothetical protein